MIVDFIKHIITLWNNIGNSTLFIILLGISINLITYKITSKYIKKIKIYYKEHPDGIRIAIQNKSNMYLSDTDFINGGKILQLDNIGLIKRIDNTENIVEINKYDKLNVINIKYLRQKSSVIFKLKIDKISLDKIKTGHQKGFKDAIKVKKAFGLKINWIVLKIMMILLGFLLLLLSFILFLAFLANLDIYLIYPSFNTFINLIASICCIFLQISFILFYLQRPLINSEIKKLYFK